MKVVIYDIETLFEMFFIGVYIPETDEWFEFEVSAYKNNLDGFLRFIEDYKEYFWVGYNNLRFDSQVVEWVIRNCEKWHELSSLEVCAMIHQFAQDTIDDANYEVFPKYQEWHMTLRQIDIFKVNHYDNKNRMVSLKRLEFEMDFENIEEMPIHHAKIGLTPTERYLTRTYCKNDVMATYEFWKITIGETEHPLYKENNQIQLREDILSEFGVPCMNYSDSKIGDEIIKKFYCQEKGIDPKELPRKGFFRKTIEVKNCIAPYIKFVTPEMQKFLDRIQKMKMGMNDEFVEEIKFYGNTYTFAKGGLHSVNTPMIFEEDEDHLIIDWDVSSYYPAIIINNGRYPAHLGKEFLEGYKKMFEKRLELKPLAKKDKKIKGIVNALKLAVNSVYGKSSDVQSWIYDRQLTMFTTITGELSLMMLIEAYELAGINVISANTDGITIRIKKSLMDKMFEINDWWCKLTKYELERADYKKIIFSTVNDYIAIKTDGEVKKKGDFLTDFELHKNKSGRVVNIALEKYFVNDIPVEETIKNHKNAYDFCLRQKASRDFHYEGVNRATGEKSVYHKLIRYYISTEGEKLYKVKNEECDTKAAKISQVEAGEWLCTVCNYLPRNKELTNIDYKFYIDKAESMILKIITNGKKKKVESLPGQISLF